MPSSTRLPEPGSLLEATRAPDYFARVSEVVRAFETAADPVQAVELLAEATRRMGAEVAIFASFIRDDELYASYRLLLACDPRWCVEYDQLSGFEDDPWLKHARHHSEPIRGSELRASSPTERSLLELGERFGFRSAVVVPAPSSGGLSRLGMLCLGSSVPGYFEDDGYVAFKVVARSVAMELHEWWIARLKDDLLLASRLSEAELALLAQEHQGRSTKVIARALAASPSAIDSRFRRINAKLGVPNRKAAARLAAEYGLI